MNFFRTIDTTDTTDTTIWKPGLKKKRQIQLVVRDRVNSICPMNCFRTTDTTDTTIWKPGLTLMQMRSKNELCFEDKTEIKLRTLRR